MFEQTFKNIDDILHKDAGCSSELDYVEQTSWVLFLKYLDDFDQDKKTAAELSGRSYAPIIDKKYRWEAWAAPKNKEGKLDHHKAQNGDDLKDFVDQKLFPYLKQFKVKAESPDTIQYKIGEIFSELKNKLQSGYNLREVINLIDELRFRSSKEQHEMSHLYESKIQNMGNAGRNGGEYYTPRPLIRTIVKVVAPEIGNTIYDGAVGSAGFLCEAFEYLKKNRKLSTKDMEKLQKSTFYGKEKKSLAYIIGIMNMILHGIEAPNIIHTNTLSQNIADVEDKDRFDIILANPPFGGKERKEVQQNFPIKTGETAFLFLQHFIKILKAGGRAGVVIKNTFLSNSDNASVSLRKTLLEGCRLYAVLDLPGGVFQGAGVKTVILFFEKGAPTRKIWYYQLNLDRNLGKTNPLSEEDLAEFVKLQASTGSASGMGSGSGMDKVSGIGTGYGMDKVSGIGSGSGMGKVSGIGSGSGMGKVSGMGSGSGMGKVSGMGSGSGMGKVSGVVDSENSWTVDMKDVDDKTFDLSVKNPYKKDETVLRDPKEILEEMKVLDKESAELLKKVEGLL